MTNTADVPNLDDLKTRFNPRRSYQNHHTTIEVDGVFVRFDEDEWEFSGGNVTIPLEDFLQDPSIVRSARVSTGRETKEVGEKGVGLIGALYRDRHETPFEGSVMFRLKVTTPICDAQSYFQLHYVHNEFSGRYSIIDGDFYTPKAIEENPIFASIWKESGEESHLVYKALLEEHSVAREQARLALLYRFYTKFYWTVSLRHILELLSLERNVLAPDEFWEVRDELLAQMVKDWVPWAYENTVKYPREIKTAWHKDVWSEKVGSVSSFVDESLEGSHSPLFEGPLVKVGNVGEMHLVGHNGFEQYLRAAVQTKPNPRRGFGHASMTFLLHVPIFVHRQWVRHRYGVWSELPVDFDGIVREKDFYIPDRFRKQVGKPMAYTFEDTNDDENRAVQLLFRDFLRKRLEIYQTSRQLGVAPELAAQNLPYTFRIHVLWTVNLESLMNFFSLRCDEHAQWEIRQFANEIYRIFKKLYPWPDEIFLRYLNFGKSPLFQM
ncbi:MAG: FAD-dependent thymidylate synthase [Minisyncoccia bacterium]|jgi:thymidylate synthase (FAD)